ncbi:MAG: serine/threonine protein kinase, partial [Oscillatoriales cyanobacterium SM2_2_1]|nr:serine/threonine protein kinase [Oscillatoriales cyanobacterium SM2_2_1]
MIGQTVDGRYRIEKPLGRGGFGHTYLARDLRIPGEPHCVVKHLQPASNETDYLQVASRLFYSEAEILAKLGHCDRIPRLLAYFQEQTNHEFYLVEEYIAGETLSQELTAGRRFDEAQVRQLLIDVLELLEFIHLQGVIHRDVKPENLIRRVGDRRWVLIDFGAIKQITQSQLHQLSAGHTVAIGTPGYIPVEQAQGKPRPSSDLYALGMVAIQTLTHIHPQQLPEDPQTGAAQWQHLAPPLGDALSRVICRMTHPYWQERYTSARQVLDELKDSPTPAVTILPTVVLSPEPTTMAQPPVAVAPMPSSCSPFPWTWLIGASGAIVAGSTLAWFMSRPQTAPISSGQESVVVRPTASPAAKRHPNPTPTLHST